MELPLAAVFSISFGPTGGPHVAVFRRFQQTWPSVLAWSTSGYPSTTQWSTITRRKYPNVSVAKAASTALCRHLWYIQEVLVGLSLFDDRIGADVKSQMVTNLCLPQSTHSVKRLDCPPEPFSSTATGLAFCFTEMTNVTHLLEMSHMAEISVYEYYTWF